MSIALTYSLAGMQAAADRMAIRSRNVANVATPGYEAVKLVQEETEFGPAVFIQPSTDGALFAQGRFEDPGGETGNQPLLPFDDLPQDDKGTGTVPEFSNVSLAYELTDMILAENAYKASALTARTVGEVEDTLLDIFA